MSVAPPDRKPTPLAEPVATLPGVGRERAALLAKLEILTIEDLLLHRPRRYEDRRQFRKIADLQLGAPATTRGAIVAMGVKWFAQHTKSIFEIILDDGTADVLASPITRRRSFHATISALMTPST